MSARAFSRRSFLKASALIAGASGLLAGMRSVAGTSARGRRMAYVGTFSSPLRNMLPTQVDLPPGNGRGIHLFEVDRVSGALSARGVLEQPSSPDCLAIHPDGAHLYATNETDRSGEGGAGSVSAFAIGRDSGELTLLNTMSSEGAGPTNVSIHPSGRFLLVANYFGGSVAVLPIEADGSIGRASDVKKDAGTVGPRKATNAPPGSFAVSGHDGPHAHMIQADASGRFVFSTDLGLDQIRIWKFDEHSGALSPNDPPFVSLPAGDGPRHFAFHPNRRWFYSLQEEASTIVLWDLDDASGRLAARQTVSSLPPGFAGSSFSSGILISRDGRFVYAANRLHDSIAWFAVGKTGTLSFRGEEWTRGDYPRSFNFDPAGDFVYVCNQRSDTVASFKVNHRSGALTFTGQYAPVGNPSMIAFLDLGASGV